MEPISQVKPGLSRVALALCLFLTIWGVKLSAIDRFGSDLAFWDQWAKEGENLYPAWLARHELWKNLFLPHNEHRIAPTLALDLGLVAWGGQWDSRVQCVASAALHAAIAVGLLLWALRHLSRGWALGSAALLALVGACCIARDNVLTGFQSQFYFLSAFSLLALAGLLAARAFSLRWWGGFAAGALALVSMGSGLLCAAVISALTVPRVVARTTRRGAIPTLGAGRALGGAGLWLRTPAPWHDTLHAHGLGLLGYAARCLAWPLHTQPWLALMIWLPWFALAVRRLKSLREPFDAAVDFVLAGGAWVLLQTVAVSYARGGPGGVPASRYGDVFAFGAVFSFFALALLAGPFQRRRGIVLGSLWFATIALAIVVAARPVWRDQLPKEKIDRLTYERNVHQFILTDDYAGFEKQTLPFPLAEWLARILRQPNIRAILPASVRAPLRIDGLDDAATLPIPALGQRGTRAMLRGGEWRSGPLPAGHGWWKIETAGSLGEPGTLLQLVAVADGHTLDSIAPSKLAGNSWRAAYVRAPAEPALLVARTDDAAHWFAFSEPVEMSSLSYDAWQLTRLGRWLALFGISGGLVIVVLRRRDG